VVGLRGTPVGALAFDEEDDMALLAACGADGDGVLLVVRDGHGLVFEVA
jgi:hypothetical protein